MVTIETQSPRGNLQSRCAADTGGAMHRYTGCCCNLVGPERKLAPEWRPVARVGGTLPAAHNAV